MKAIDLDKENLKLSQLFGLARNEPVLLVVGNGEEFIISKADDFETEVEALRNSERFQRFLDERSESKTTFSLEEVEKEIDADLSRSQPG